MVSSLHEAVDKGTLDELPDAIQKFSSELNDLNDSDGFTPLILAVSKRNTKMVKLLLDAGANANIACVGTSVNAGYTGVHIAAKNGDIDMIIALAKAGADLNLEGSDSWTPMHCAAFAGKRMSMQCLLDNGAKVDAPNRHGLTPLMYVANHGKLHETRDLVRRGANIAAKDQNGDTVLHHAMHYQMFKLFEGEYDMPECQYDTMTLLAMSGADPDVKNNEGKLCTEYAVDGVRDVLRILYHHCEVFKKSTTDWNYMTLLSAQIEHFIGLGLPLRHASDLFEAMKKADKNRIDEKKQREEERKNQGGCPIIRSKKKKPEIPADGSDPSNGQCPFFNKDKKDEESNNAATSAAPNPHKGIDMANVPKDGSDPSNGQCPFFKKKEGKKEDTEGAKAGVVAAPHQQMQQQQPMTFAQLLFDNRTSVLMCIICFLLGILLERKFKFA